MLKILGRASSSNVQKVLWLLGELHLPYEREDVGGRFGRNQDTNYLALNPNGLVPTLIDGPFVLWESNSICRYLANRFGPTPMYPLEPRNRGLCERWMDWQLSTLSPALGPFYVQMVRTPVGERDAQLIDASRKHSRTVLGVLDQTLGGSAFLSGEDLTLADICNGIWAHRWFMLTEGKLGDFSRLRCWYERLSTRAAFRDCILNIQLE